MIEQETKNRNFFNSKVKMAWQRMSSGNQISSKQEVKKPKLRSHQVDSKQGSDSAQARLQPWVSACLRQG